MLLDKIIWNTIFKCHYLNSNQKITTLCFPCFAVWGLLWFIASSFYKMMKDYCNLKEFDNKLMIIEKTKSSRALQICLEMVHHIFNNLDLAMFRKRHWANELPQHRQTVLRSFLPLPYGNFWFLRYREHAWKTTSNSFCGLSTIILSTSKNPFIYILLLLLLFLILWNKEPIYKTIVFVDGLLVRIKP